MSPRLSLALLIPFLPVAVASSQVVVRANGIAFDSLSGRPLASAVIFLGSRSTLADSAGRFAFDSLAPGTYRVIMQHDALDSLGLSEIAASVMIRGPSDTIRISTPSSRTMWRRVCPGEQPRDSGFVFGIVRGAARKPVTGVIIAATWIELVSVGRGVVQKGWKLETKSTEDGSYAICGMPVGTGAGLEATLDSAEYAGVHVMLTERSSVRRQDLTMADVRDSVARGTIRGTVTSEGQALSNVRIETDGMPEVRTGSDGGFIIRNVRAGTCQVYIQSVGFAPQARIVVVPRSGWTA